MSELEEQREQRIQKLETLRKRGIEPYPYKYDRTHKTVEILKNYELYQGKEVKIAGRIISIRGHGKASFAHIIDDTGKIQVYLKEDRIGKEKYEIFKLFDIGDVVGISGNIFKTKTEEITVEADEISLLCKSLRLLPEKWHGLKDIETRSRQRYLDLMVNIDVRRIFSIRSKIITYMRKFLDERGFLEVETPVLQPQYGGAFARPFVTHHNTLDCDLFLRISDELYLKRLIIGGMERVYEFGKDFRNEGVDRMHNPEFTMLEVYQAYADYYDMMKLTEEMLCYILVEITGSTKIIYQGAEIDFSPPWRRISLLNAIKEEINLDIKCAEISELMRICNEHNVPIKGKEKKGELIDLIFSKLVQPKLIQPVFILDYPIEMTPLAKKKRDEPLFVERFEPIIAGMEVGNAFSELNDPIDQKERFEEQMKMKEEGFSEAQPLDSDFLRALEYGMPPTGGLGIGIDRIAMLFTDSHSIRDVILFPLLRPER